MSDSTVATDAARSEPGSRSKRIYVVAATLWLVLGIGRTNAPGAASHELPRRLGAYAGTVTTLAHGRMQGATGASRGRHGAP